MQSLGQEVWVFRTSSFLNASRETWLFLLRHSLRLAESDCSMISLPFHLPFFSPANLEFIFLPTLCHTQCFTYGKQSLKVWRENEGTFRKTSTILPNQGQAHLLTDSISSSGTLHVAFRKLLSCFCFLSFPCIQYVYRYWPVSQRPWVESSIPECLMALLSK